MRTDDFRQDHIRILSDPARIDRSDWDIAHDLKTAGHLKGMFYRNMQGGSATFLDVQDLKVTVPGRAYLQSLKAQASASKPIAVVARWFFAGLGAAALAAISIWVAKIFD